MFVLHGYLGIYQMCIHLCEEITHNEHLAIEGPISDLPETNLIDQKEHVYISMT